MRIDISAAGALYARLPIALQVATLSPAYVKADASRSTEIQPTYWSYEEADWFWYHGFHLTALPDVPGFDIQSPYGYGGPVANSHDVGFLNRAWRAYVEWARAAGIAAEFIRLHPLAENASFYGGRIDEDRQTVWIDLQADRLFAEYQTRVRTSIRKAEKSGMRFSWVNNDEIPGRFASFYRAAMDAISASPFYFFDDAYFAQLAAWPAAKLGVCLLDDQWVSAGLFLYGGNTVEYHLAASTGLGKRFSASNLLLHEVGTSAKAEGYSRLYLGGGTDRRPDNPLYFYKSGFSKCRAPFNVGTYCHDPERYELLKQRWPDRYAANTDKLLFYR
jgi:hypothetical protein